MSNFTPCQIKIKDFIAAIETGKYQLPCFQRDFKWNPARIKSLLNSIQHVYPAGTLLFLRVDRDNPLIPCQEFKYADKSKFTEKPEILVLDGQQRMTSCYTVFTNRGFYTYYVDFYKLMELYNDGNTDFDFDTVIVHKRHNSTPMTELAKGLFPMAYLRDRKTMRDQLKIYINGVKDDPEKADVCDFLNYSFGDIVDPILDYEFPVVELPATSSLGAVCKVFQTINTTGLKLSVFDICVAVFMPKGINLKDKVKESSEQYPLAKMILEKDATMVLQVIALLANKLPNSNKLAEVLEARDINDYWGDAIEAIEITLEMFDGFGAGTKKSLVILPYTPMVTIVAAVLARTKYKSMSVANKGNVQTKIKSYFYTAALSTRYTEGTNAKINDDFKSLNQWISSDQKPSMIEHGVDWNTQKVIDNNKNGAFGKAVLCMLNGNNPEDFYLGKTVGIGESIESCDLHHIFPKAKYETVYPDNIDSVFNFTWLTKETNIYIKDKKTSEYLNDILIDTGKTETALINLFTCHIIETKQYSFIKSEDYLNFLIGRAELFKNRFINVGVYFHDVNQDDLDVEEDENEDEE